MAKAEFELRGGFNDIARAICDGIARGSLSASMEDETVWRQGDITCGHFVFERYSMIGSNRVSLSVALLAQGDTVRLSAITSGGSQAVLFKLNTLGENAFLDKLLDIVERYERRK